MGMQNAALKKKIKAQQFKDCRLTEPFFSLSHIRYFYNTLFQGINILR